MLAEFQLRFELHARIQKILSEGVQLRQGFFFLDDEGWEDPNITKRGPSLARQPNATKMMFCWHADDGPILNTGS